MAHTCSGGRGGGCARAGPLRAGNGARVLAVQGRGRAHVRAVWGRGRAHALAVQGGALWLLRGPGARAGQPDWWRVSAGVRTIAPSHPAPLPTHTPRTWPAHGPHMARTWPAHARTRPHTPAHGAPVRPRPRRRRYLAHRVPPARSHPRCPPPPPQRSRRHPRTPCRYRATQTASHRHRGCPAADA
eukprot:3175288-Prymnesium_polylepis.1